jgi:hypothetical protein
VLVTIAGVVHTDCIRRTSARPLILILLPTINFDRFPCPCACTAPTCALPTGDHLPIPIFPSMLRVHHPQQLLSNLPANLTASDSTSAAVGSAFFHAHHAAFTAAESLAHILARGACLARGRFSHSRVLGRNLGVRPPSRVFLAPPLVPLHQIRPCSLSSAVPHCGPRPRAELGAVRDRPHQVCVGRPRSDRTPWRSAMHSACF